MLPTWHPLQAAGSGAARPTSAKPSSRLKPRPSPNPGPNLSLRTCEPSPWLLWFSPGQSTLLSPPQLAQQPPKPHPANLSPCNPGRPDQFNGPGPPPPPRGGTLPPAVPGWSGGLSDSRQPRQLQGLLQRLWMAAEARIATIAGRQTPRCPHFLGPLNASPHPGSAFSDLGHSLSTPPDGSSRSCNHLCFPLKSEGPQILLLGMMRALPLLPYYKKACHRPEDLFSPPLGRKNRGVSYLVKSSSASMCLGMGE